MYKSFIRPLLFLINPERVHHIVVFCIKTLNYIPGAKMLMRIFFSTKTQPFEFLGLHFKNRVGLAAGFDKNAEFYNEFTVFGFGHIEIGTVTPKAQIGNQKPRSFRLPKDKALINRMGFNNLGVDAAVEKLKHRKAGLIIGGNIGKNTMTPNEIAVNDYIECFEKLYDSVDYFVINVSCPNITDLRELQDKDALKIILQRIAEGRSNKNIKKPILLKISPDLNFSQIDDTLKLIMEIGIDGVVVSNTTITRNNLKTDVKNIEQIGRGGMSGQPIRDRSTEMIRYISERTNKKLPIIGVGGIMSENDAIEKIKAGAGLVQVYTGFIYEGPMIVKRLNKAIRSYETKKVE
jgi:dihydroorotate dehydrogenase